MADTSSEEIPPQYRRYPITALLVIINLTMSSLSSYGVNTFLLYLIHKLHFPEEDATSLVHGLSVAGAFMSIVGFYLSENVIGRFYNTLSFSILENFGRILLLVASFDMWWFPMNSMTWVAEVFIIISGARGISRMALGADQFKYPYQKQMRSEYFVVCYFAYNAGGVLSNIYFPELRVTNCGMTECFPLVFGVALILTALSALALVVGWFHFYRPEVKSGVTVKTIRCAFSAAKNRLLGPRQDLEHWAEYADHSTYDEDIRNDTSQMSRALWMYLPVPLFHALFLQTESTWVSQALLMTGKFGDKSGIKADQMFSLNPFLVLILIPLCSFALYPLLKKVVGIERPLGKMILGLSLISLAFFMTAGLQFIIDSKVPPLPQAGQGAVCFGNVKKEAITLSAADCSISEVTIEPGGYACIRELNVEREKECHLTSTPPVTGTFKLFEKETTTVFLDQTVFQSETQHADPEKEDSGFPKFRFYFDLAPSVKGPLILRISGANDIKVDLPDPKTFTSYEKDIQENQCIDLLIGVLEGNFTGGPGGVYDIFITNGTEKELGVFPVIVTEENSVHRLWQVPQFIILTLGEVMFSITLNEFNYTESPHSMKTLLSAVESVCSAIGNLLIVVLKQMNMFDSMAYDFMLYAILMLLANLILVYLSWGYVYLDDRTPEEERIRRHSSAIEAEAKLKRGASEYGKTSQDALVPRKSKTA